MEILACQGETVIVEHDHHFGGEICVRIELEFQRRAVDRLSDLVGGETVVIESVEDEGTIAVGRIAVRIDRTDIDLVIVVEIKDAVELSGGALID
jgi:hypothetical protein